MIGMNKAGAQVIMSAAIGGTAEALGGGKFANGAVTGAYVMMFNHLGDMDGRNGGPEKDPYDNYGEIKGGVNFSGGLTIGVGYTIEFGWITTENGYVQYYYTVYGTASSLSANLSANSFLVQPLKSNTPLLSSFKGKGYELGGSYFIFGAQRGYDVNRTFMTNTVGFGKSISFPYKLGHTLNTGTTYFIGNPIKMGTKPNEFTNWYLRTGGMR
jgi:hypothetical protein